MSDNCVDLVRCFYELVELVESVVLVMQDIHLLQSAA